MTDFYRRVYRMVECIPPGRVATYGQIAALLGYTHGARAVGWALHALPPHTSVPWHRVVSAAGQVSSSCQEHPAAEQCDRLRAEGVSVDEAGRLDLAAHRWQGLHWAEVEALLHPFRSER